MGVLLELAPILPANSCSFYKAQLQSPLQVFLGPPKPTFPSGPAQVPQGRGDCVWLFPPEPPQGAKQGIFDQRHQPVQGSLEDSISYETERRVLISTS